MTGWECASFGVTRRERDNEKTLGENWGGIAGGGQEGSRVGMGAIGGGITGLSDSECNRGGCQSSRRDCANSAYLCKYVRLDWGLCGGLANAEDGGIADGAIASRCGATVFEGDFFGVLNFAGCATLETIGFHQTSLQKLEYGPTGLQDDGLIG